MGRVKTYIAGSPCPPGDLNAIQDDYEHAFAIYHDVRRVSASVGPTLPAGTYVIPSGSGVFGVAVVPGTGASAGAFVIYLDPSDFLAGSRTAALRLRALMFTDAVAPGADFVFGLYPVAAFIGASGAYPSINTVGTVVAGSVVNFAAPGTNVSLQGVSADFSVPAAGFYTIGVNISAATVADAAFQILATLQSRQV